MRLEDGRQYIEGFMNKWPTLKRYIKVAIRKCTLCQGYIFETVPGTGTCDVCGNIEHIPVGKCKECEGDLYIANEHKDYRCEDCKQLYGAFEITNI